MHAKRWTGTLHLKVHVCEYSDIQQPCIKWSSCKNIMHNTGTFFSYTCVTTGFEKQGRAKNSYISVFLHVEYISKTSFDSLKLLGPRSR